MKFLKICNKGEIDARSLFFVGASSKRGNENKIGQFGSGNKFALAYFLRNNYSIRIYSGDLPIDIKTKIETFRGIDIEVICVDGQKTSITTDMGYKWECWQAFREVYSNAIDEGDAYIEVTSNISPIYGTTSYYIELKPELEEVYNNMDRYFSTNRIALYEDENGAIYERLWGEESFVYRKGINCTNGKINAVFDYDFNDLHISEDRIFQYNWQVKEKIWEMIASCSDKDIIKRFFDRLNENSYEFNMTFESMPYKKSDEFEDVVKSVKFVPDAFASTIQENKKVIALPLKVYNSIVNKHDNDFGVIKGEVPFHINYELKQKGTILEDVKRLFEHKLHPDLFKYDFFVVKFGDKEMVSEVEEDRILISEDYSCTMGEILKALTIASILLNGNKVDFLSVMEYIFNKWNHEIFR